MIEKQNCSTDFPEIICQEERNRRVHAGQCDCACATSNLLNVEPSVFPADNGFLRSDPFVSVPLIPDYYAVIGRGPNVAVLNHSALKLVNNPCSFWQKHSDETGLHSTLTQMIKLGLLLPEACPVPEPDEHAATLFAWLHITDQCNLRCAYCYLPHLPTEMSMETGRAAIDATFRSALEYGYKEIKLKYAGGEPLLRFEFISELHKYAQGLAGEHGISLDGVVLSNGTLLRPDIIEQILSLDLRLMISLDGLDSFHDCQRFHADGRGSSSAVLEAINLAVSYNLIPDISITVSGRNAAGLPELIAWLLERDLPFGINFYRENEHSVSEADLQIEDEKMIGGMLAAYKIIESDFPQTNLLTSLADHANFSAPHLKPCSVGSDYLVFDTQGHVAKCQMDMNRIVTDIHDPNPLAHIRKNDRGIQNLSVDEKNGCQECKWRYWCAGGCPLLTYRATGRHDLKSPNCNIYKAIFPKIIRMEGLCLLREHQRLS